VKLKNEVRKVRKEKVGVFRDALKGEGGVGGVFRGAHK
jgi:hypothetical protein